MIKENTFFSDKKVLIIGGTGYIGSLLSQKLKLLCKKIDIIGRESPYSSDVDYFDLDITDIDEMDVFFKKNTYDIIYHLAALISVGDSLKFPYIYYKVNSIGTLNLIECVRKYQNKPLIIFNSTGLIYGNPINFPIDENHPLLPNNPYASTKEIAEKILEDFSRTFGIPVTIFRLFTVYGPNQKTALFVPSFIKRCLNEKVLSVGNIYPTRDFIYIDDVLSALILAPQKTNNEFSVYNIASGIEISIEDVIHIILKETNRSFEDVKQDPKFMRPKSAEISRIAVNIEKAKNKLDWMPKINITEGMSKTIESYRS